ncbi:hypothetical protein GcC1_139013 [Golovinomyces cichoracearum]|uniref:DNA-directed RNA polymerase III subunit rpc5 n=1 Tax=Golovinomyces cichoracearum TaxID=62708 RepID=A0A420I123_9PEZI|nr:hypothetical protein GcC1_139013 [Golovinomyces cichoracearum]
MDQDNDPIKATYNVFVKPRISEDRQVYILQFPNRDSRQNYNANLGAEPFKMRIKPVAGMVEMDVPIDPFNNYDREKGIKWGDALRKSKIAKGGGSHGLPGGFGIGGAQSSGRGKGKGGVAGNDETNHESVMADYETAVQKEQVLIRQTLGGQAISKDATTPQYMIGTFRKDQLHLTPVDNIVQMRPQFHHIDAAVEQERSSRVRETNVSAKSEAKAVQMTVKSQIDGENSNNAERSMAARIAAAQSEAWKAHRYVDEDTDEAWLEYSESMFVCSKLEKTEEMLAQLPRLKSTYNDTEYMDLISGQRDSARLAKKKVKEKISDSENVKASNNLDSINKDSDSSMDSEDDGLQI